jgi:hypothetical protein
MPAVSDSQDQHALAADRGEGCRARQAGREFKHPVERENSPSWGVAATQKRPFRFSCRLKRGKMSFLLRLYMAQCGRLKFVAYADIILNWLR